MAVKVYTHTVADGFEESSTNMSLSPPIVTLLIVVGAAIGLVVLVGLALVLRDPGAARRRVESAFRRPPRPPKTAGDEQYYKPYWSR